MYNHRVATNYYEIRICESCGLRYPLVTEHPFGTRCPACMGETQVALKQEIRSEEVVARGEKEARRTNLAVLLDNVRSAWNVGSILRSADGFGLMHAYLCGITPSADHGAVTKTSLGAEESVPWSYHRDALKLVKGLKMEGWKVYALEEDARAVEIHQTGAMDTAQNQVLIVGNEVTGVDPGLLDLCDQILYLPMYGEKRSFNVAIAFSIAAYALHNKEERLSRRRAA